MSKLTISAALSMEKSLRARLGQLKDLRDQVSTHEIWGDKDKQTKPMYDVKEVDKKITKINKALFRVDQKIKEKNATTKIDLDLDYDELVSEIE